MITLIKICIKVERYLFAKLLKVWDIAKLFHKIFNVAAQHPVRAASAGGRRGVGHLPFSGRPGGGSRLVTAFSGRQPAVDGRHGFAAPAAARGPVTLRVRRCWMDERLVRYDAQAADGDGVVLATVNHLQFDAVAALQAAATA